MKSKNMTYKRLALTAVVLLVWLAAKVLHDYAQPEVVAASGVVAGLQFQSSDAANLAAQGAMKLASDSGLPFWPFGLAVLAIWLGPLRRWLGGDGNRFIPTLAFAGVVALVFVQPPQAMAYFAVDDKTEAYTILPNESAFWVPDTGDNRGGQAQLDSEDYLKSRKLAVKRFVIPHHKLGNSGGFLGWDYYVPDGRLIVVDRTPYSREWVGSAHRGTSSRDESIPCQSKEGLNISVGVSIGASVSEDDAAKFLYRFGVAPPTGNRTDGQVIFASVYYGRNLSSVMDDVAGRKSRPWYAPR